MYERVFLPSFSFLLKKKLSVFFLSNKLTFVHRSLSFSYPPFLIPMQYTITRHPKYVGVSGL